MATVPAPRIETCTPAHAEVLGALHALCFDRAWPATTFAKLLARPAVFGLVASARADGHLEPLGFVLCQTAADEAEVLTICVAPDQRRRGVASALLEGAFGEAAARGTATMFLEVAANDAGARAFYDALGFVGHGVRPDYYETSAGRVDAAILRRAI